MQTGQERGPWLPAPPAANRFDFRSSYLPLPGSRLAPIHGVGPLSCDATQPDDVSNPPTRHAGLLKAMQHRDGAAVAGLRIGPMACCTIGDRVLLIKLRPRGIHQREVVAAQTCARALERIYLRIRNRRPCNDAEAERSGEQSEPDH